MREEIERLLSEVQRSRLAERRTEPRHHFVRPVQIYFSHGPIMSAFSKDISAQGMGIVCDAPIGIGSFAILEIHSTQGAPVTLRSEVRWCDPYGKGWFLIGWKFVAIVARPMV